MFSAFRYGNAARSAKPMTAVLTAGLSALALSGCAGVLGNNYTEVSLRGSEEVPPVQTNARASGTLRLNADRSLSGKVTTIGLQGVAAHIHHGAAGENGPVSIGLVKIADNIWAVPANTTLSEDQYRAFLKGELYVNVHTPAHKGGEIRGQLRPLTHNW